MKPKVTILPDGTQQAPFQYDFAVDAKSLVADVDANGDIWIEGYASDWGVDRQDEAFEPGAFERGLKAFLERNPIMLYHHQYDKALGQFTDARVDSKGLWVRGRVDAPAAGSWAEDVFNKIRKGTIRAFSVGGIFRRRGDKIYDCDLGEISVTPFPVNPRTTFAVVAKKAFDAKAEEGPTSAAEQGNEPIAGTTPSPAEDSPKKDEGEVQKEIADEAAQQASGEKEGTEESSEQITENQEVKEEKTEPKVGPNTVTQEAIAPGAVTSEKIMAGAVTVEHLSDDLRSRFQEFRPEAPDVADAHKRIGDVAAKLEMVYDRIGLTDPLALKEEYQPAA